MNAMGMMLLASIAQATLFAVAGAAAYLAIRRWGPAAGSLAAGTSLAVMAMVSILALGPWPRWWTLGDDGGMPPSPAALRENTPPAIEVTGAPTAVEPARSADPVPSIGAAPTARPPLLEPVLDELRRPVARGARVWGWREWLASGFLAGLAVGAARLGLGLWGIARLRARSRRVEDGQLSDLIAILRAELGCTREVECREAAELTTPATIGWRRPVVLLPSDWRTWDHDERRAVLAHELAHVRRGDFAAGVAAQLALATQFYHPLAHWFSARLRLEQELAADAWGARLSGGKSPYLAALARMALRRDGRAPTWPARAFLPSHGTFVRRIEMLKNQKSIRHDAPPPAARVLTVLALATVGLLVAGLRGPAGDSPALAQDRPAEKPAATPDVHSLIFVPAEARMVVSFRPSSLLRRRDVRRLLDPIRERPWFRQGYPVPPEEIEQVHIFWATEPAYDGPEVLPPPSGLVVRTSRPQDWRAIRARRAGPDLAESKHDGQPYYRLGSGGRSPWGVYTPDERTAVVAEEGVLRDLISDRQAPMPGHPWDEAWRRVDPGQLMVGLDTRWLRRQITRPSQRYARGLSLDLIAPLYDKARSYAASLEVSDQSMVLDLVAASGSPEDAKLVAETLQALLTLGRNALHGVRRDGARPAGAPTEAFEWVVPAAESALSDARVETKEGFVHLHSAPRFDLAEAIAMLLQAVAKAHGEARRYDSVENLKRIALACHNYATMNHRLPAAVNRDKGKFPYSWRVAILPFLETKEQRELYFQYHFDEPWDGPNNIKLIDRMPAIYAYPGPDGRSSGPGDTAYFLFTGPMTLGGAEGGSKLDEITDGVSRTLLAVEAKREIPWTRPEDIPFDPAPTAAPPELRGFTPDGFNAVFADGSVRYIKKTIKPFVLKALITRDGGEVISSDSY